MNELDLTFWLAWMEGLEYINGFCTMDPDDLSAYCMGNEL